MTDEKYSDIIIKALKIDVRRGLIELYVDIEYLQRQANLMWSALATLGIFFTILVAFNMYLYYEYLT